MIKVGLTGNIGSGKSTVARVFQVLKTPVYHADDEAKKILDSRDIISKLINIYSNDILDTDGKVDRKKLARIIFNDQNEVNKLNRIIHPLIEKDFEQWVKKHKDIKYLIHEAAILFESGFDKLFDKIIFVSAPKETRIQRIIKRDNISRDEVLKRMQFQQDEKEKIPLSDFVINNDDSQPIIPQVLKIHQNLSLLSD